MDSVIRTQLKPIDHSLPANLFSLSRNSSSTSNALSSKFLKIGFCSISSTLGLLLGSMFKHSSISAPSYSPSSSFSFKFLGCSVGWNLNLQGSLSLPVQFSSSGVPLSQKISISNCSSFFPLMSKSALPVKR